MFDFFEKVAKGIGFKLIDNFSDKVEEWIKGIFENCQNASSGDYAQNASSGYNAQNASSGDYAQNASSGYGAQNASSGDNAQNASSGYNAKNASSGDYAKNASSGYNAKNASSGDYAKNASSGDYAQNASSGYNAQNASSGDYAQNASSGDYAQNASSGYGAQNASSGDYAKNVISGKNSICFDCGYKGTIKAVKGTWIALAEYKRDNNDKMIPVFAKTAQIGNKEYTDVRKRVLKSNAEYILWNKEFCEVVEIDGIKSIILSEKKRDNIKIIKAVDIRDIYKQDKDQIEAMYIATEGKISAHGYTVREAIDDLTYKKLDNVDSEEIIAEIKRTGKVTRSQYRALTGACSFGTNKFCEEHNIQDLEEIEISELRKILISDYGAERFWNLIDNN
ncbi:MAG: hypothetical protein J6K45_04590 [Clostridia bacterium]|nr:hypothetical protein [Clostridia bacterium]